jgi:hypothetical protein
MLAAREMLRALSSNRFRAKHNDPNKVADQHHSDRGQTDLVRTALPATRTKEAGGRRVQVKLYRRGKTGPELDVVIKQK